MSKELFFNELSIVPLAPERWAGRERMNTLVKTAAAATRAGAFRRLRSLDDFSATPIAEGYSVAQWRNDGDVPLDIRQYLRLLQSKYPLVGEEDSQQIRDRLALSEFRYDGAAAHGIGAAAACDGLAVSFLSASGWDRERLPVCALSIVQDGDLEETEVLVPHAARPEAVRIHENWLRERDIPVGSGEDLWARRSALFPALEFCACVEPQLRGLQQVLVQPVRKRLRDLDAYFGSWDGGPFEPDKIAGKVTPESLPTLDRYASQRTFLCPDGVSRTFSWHARATPGAVRIYFEPLHESRRAYLSYVGDKLPTVKCPT